MLTTVALTLYRATGRHGKAKKPVQIVDFQGHRLASLFSDIPPSPRVVKSFPRFYPKPRSCAGKQSGSRKFVDAILSLFERPVEAASQCGFTCAGTYMVGISYLCGTGGPCRPGAYLLPYEDDHEGDPQGGVMQPGNWACGIGCQCAYLLCVSYGSGE